MKKHIKRLLRSSYIRAGKVVRRAKKDFLWVVAHLATRLHIMRPRIVLRVDGGICSQMNFYIIREILERQGKTVEVDLRWFRTNGRDSLGVDVRNWDFEIMWSKLPLKKASSIVSLLYESGYAAHAAGRIVKDDWMRYEAPIYMCGYYRFGDQAWYYRIFEELFHPDYSVLNKESACILQEINAVRSAGAVHVRRGDLALYHTVYGNPATEQYFYRAVKLMVERGCSAVYFFSDDNNYTNELMSFIADKLGPGSHPKMRLIDFNGPEQGYMDLLLMTACPYKVTSNGSLMRYAIMLSGKTTKMSIYEKDSVCNEHIPEYGEVVLL